MLNQLVTGETDCMAPVKPITVDVLNVTDAQLVHNDPLQHSKHLLTQIAQIIQKIENSHLPTACAGWESLRQMLWVAQQVNLKHLAV